LEFFSKLVSAVFGYDHMLTW